MIDTSVIVAISVILLLNFLFQKYVDATKDVPDLYLSEQSSVGSTRLTNESAVYKSNKLDYVDGLRVGLDIRYDTYKVRHGNFCDMWKIMVNGLKSDPQKTLTLNDTAIKVSELNYKVCQLCDHLTANGIAAVSMRYAQFLDTVESAVVVFACLINSTVLTFYDDPDAIENLGVQTPADDLVSVVRSLDSGTLLSYDYQYTFEKDKGVRIRLNKKLNNKIIRNTEYLPVNFVSSVASSIRHLPIEETMTSKDTVLVVNSDPQTSLVNTLSKVLAGFVTQSKIIITNSTNWDEIVAYKPTVVHMNERDLGAGFLDQQKAKLSVLGKLTFKASVNFLSKGKFSTFGPSSSLRLLYLHKQLREKPLYDSAGLNELRALLKCHIIVESGYENLVGSVILNDFYDYRVISPAVSHRLLSSGCVFQSLEIKLVDVDVNGYGNVIIRGYNIGKVNNYMVGKGLEERVNRDNDGFMTLQGFRGKWGNDGCLYVYE